MPQLTPPPAARAVLTRLRNAGHQALFCGGCVRDAMMGISPKDWDIATSATPDAVADIFEHTVAIGRDFGVMVVVIGDERFEVATFRAEFGYSDGRRPDSVDFTTAEEDVRRRDFTINALLYDPEADVVIDHVGGRADIAARILRTVGEPAKRFGEDRLRMLRAVRFAARTGFQIEPQTRAAIAEMAGMVTSVSPERIAEELGRMLCCGSSAAAITMLEETGLLVAVLPEVAAMRGVPQPPRFHPEGGVMAHTLIMLRLMDACQRGDFAAAQAESALPDPRFTHAEKQRGMAPADLDRQALVRAAADTWSGLADRDRAILAWAVLLHDIGKPLTMTVTDRIRFNDHDKRGTELAGQVLERLRRPRWLIEGVKDAIARHMHFANLRRMRQAKLRRWLQEPSFLVHLELHRLDCESSHRMLQNYAFGLAAWRAEQARPPEKEPLLRGRDLAAMGFPPGPRMGEIIAAVAEARLEGTLSTRAEAQAFVRERFGS